MIIDQLNLNHIRIFERVFAQRSMTSAARELHLTQSGVSQHIKSLENILNVRLFDRIKQRLIPTPSATVLHEQCSRHLQEIEETLATIQHQNKQLSGTVTIGMPVEFGNNIILPLLANFSKDQPLVKFRLRFDFASQINAMLLNGEMDFGFVDNIPMDPLIQTEDIYDETLKLCVSKKHLKGLKEITETRAFFESLTYVAYQNSHPMLNMWFAHHLKLGKPNLKIRATVMDVQGVSCFILSGMGAGILPGHVLSKLQQNLSGTKQSLHYFRGCGRPLKNTIRIASLREKSHSLAAQSVLTWLKTALTKNTQEHPSVQSTRSVLKQS